MNEHQTYERDWWGDCVNTFTEESKQQMYAQHMGLVDIPCPETHRTPRYDLGGRSVLDLGGGPVSLLLKCIHRGAAAIVDPCPYPAWTRARYASVGITVFEEPAETFRTPERFDEVWVYNVLQHVDDPEAVIATAKAHGNLLRIFDWLNVPATLGHPHVLTREHLDRWIGTPGVVVEIEPGWHAYTGAITL